MGEACLVGYYLIKTKALLNRKTAGRFFSPPWERIQAWNTPPILCNSMYRAGKSLQFASAGLYK